MRVGASLVEALPRSIVVLPVTFEEHLKAVIAVASLHDFDQAHLSFLEQLTASIGIVLNSIEATMQTEGLLKQSQELAGELQVQQKELQKTNEQLEQKAQQLAERNVEVEAKNQEIEHARRALEEKATELALTSKYKSEFLANMSHELRTPLNSILILGQQLSENADGNLSHKQVEFARTIHGAGSDLLNLISDILDLSKIESGTVSVDAEELYLSNLLGHGGAAVPPRGGGAQPVVRARARSEPRPQYRHRFKTSAAGAEEPVVERLQVHRERRRAPHCLGGGGRLEPRASDPQQGFERHRLRGGRQRHRHSAREAEDHLRGLPAGRRSAPAASMAAPGLASPSAASWPQLLGGEIQLRSTPGMGSTFTLFLPQNYIGPLTAASEVETSRESFVEAQQLRIPERTVEAIADDRDNLNPGESVLLIVEDDPHYARILMDLAHDNGFKVLIAQRGAEALALATEFNPNAVSLDVFLPDMLGWSVLSQLKQNPLTRHIPVQMITLDEDRQHGLAQGAFSFMTKPTTVDGLREALTRIKEFSVPRRKQLLVVEDNPAEQLGIRELLHHDDIDISTASEGAEALEFLRNNTCDCVVLDLKLPDMSGFDVLESLSKDEALADIPVVVFTGRELSAEEDARLHTMARSVVVKGVELPERLLDETALFLHRIVGDLPQEKQRMLERLHESDDDLIGRTVLLVDDDARNIFALSSVLERRGMNVVTATTGREAIESLASDVRMSPSCSWTS